MEERPGKCGLDTLFRSKGRLGACLPMNAVFSPVFSLIPLFQYPDNVL